MLRAGFFSTAYHPPCSLRASGVSFEGSRHSVPLGSPMNRAPPLAVSLFLPPVLPKSLLSKRSSAIVWRLVVGAPGVPRASKSQSVPSPRGLFSACASEPPAECKGKCRTEMNQSMEIRHESDVFRQISLDFPGDFLALACVSNTATFTNSMRLTRSNARNA
jgi:hypothetical protein